MMIETLKLRPGQQKIMEYDSGWMGISAVPGSGKTWTLSLLAAQLLDKKVLNDDQEVLIVTLVNSAVDNFAHRVRQFLRSEKLFTFIGYRVRTLHGLAHDIVYERPDLVNLADDFQIIDEREANLIRSQIARTWLRTHALEAESLLDPAMENDKKQWVLRDILPTHIMEIALEFIRYAKDLRLSPEQLWQQLEKTSVPLFLAEMGCEIYKDYQRALAYRGAVDFDDLIRYALQILESDPGYLERLQYRWPFILEDEAQDSSRLQEQILRKLVGENGNWVRVGDPNQAIYESFTTASPIYFQSFLAEDGVQARPLPESGRSTCTIIDLANWLVKWTQSEHPEVSVRDALAGPPFIEPTPEGDPQPNPRSKPDQVYISIQKYTPQQEVNVVATSISRWVAENPEATIAVLAPINRRAIEVVDELRRRGIACNDSLLSSSSSTRATAKALESVLTYLSDPGSNKKLASVFQVWHRELHEPSEDDAHIERKAGLLRKMSNVEDYIWPGPSGAWLDELSANGVNDADEYLYKFRLLIRRWQSAITLPIDQLLLTIAQDLLFEPADLALAHKLAILLRQAKEAHPSWQLKELTRELTAIAQNERRFLGFSADDQGFDPDQHRGEVVVATYHKAKGLEWDRVYLLSVNNYDFPSAQAYDSYVAEKWFLRDQLQLGAEAVAQLKFAFDADEYRWYEEGDATRQARLEFVRERLRLFYVGITRAKKELVVTWNTGKKKAASPALPLIALHAYWEDGLLGDK